MEQIKIERVDAQTFQTTIARFGQIPARSMVRESFADDEDALAPARDGIGHDFFSTALSVHLRRVDEREPELDSESQSGDFHSPGAFPFPHLPRALAKDGNAGAVRQGNRFHLRS